MRHVESRLGRRLPAHELEVAVMSSLRSMLEDQHRLHRLLNLHDANIEVMRTAEKNAVQLRGILSEKSSEARAALLNLVARIDIVAGEMRIAFTPGGLHRELGIEVRAGEGEDRSSESSGVAVLTLPFEIRRRGVEARLIIGDAPQRPAKVDAGLVMQSAVRGGGCIN